MPGGYSFNNPLRRFVNGSVTSKLSAMIEDNAKAVNTIQRWLWSHILRLRSCDDGLVKLEFRTLVMRMMRCDCNCLRNWVTQVNCAVSEKLNEQVFRQRNGHIFKAVLEQAIVVHFHDDSRRIYRNHVKANRIDKFALSSADR
jgi:hypothetical protein